MPVKLTNNQFVEKANKIHNNFYIYNDVYINSISKIKIICPKHGEFIQTPNSHLSEKGCKLCAKDKLVKRLTKSKEQFIEMANKVHNNKYIYSNEYVDRNTKIKIICTRHGEFLQKPHDHLHGKGCPKCRMSKGERKIEIFLQNNSIDYLTQYKFSDCKCTYELPFDFYIPKINTVIEFQGHQHYNPISYWGGVEAYMKNIKRDYIKKEYCIKNNIKMIEIKYDENIDEKLKILL